MLRNNRFQNADSPNESEIDISTDKGTSKTFNINNLGVTETVRAEYEYDLDACTKGYNNLSQASSSDRITVIDKNDLFYICQEVQKSTDRGYPHEWLCRNKNQKPTRELYTSRKDGPKMLFVKSNNKSIKDKPKLKLANDKELYCDIANNVPMHVDDLRYVSDVALSLGKEDYKLKKTNYNACMDKQPKYGRHVAQHQENTQKDAECGNEHYIQIFFDNSRESIKSGNLSSNMLSTGREGKKSEKINNKLLTDKMRKRPIDLHHREYTQKGDFDDDREDRIQIIGKKSRESPLSSNFSNRTRFSEKVGRKNEHHMKQTINESSNYDRNVLLQNQPNIRSEETYNYLQGHLEICDDSRESVKLIDTTKLATYKQKVPRLMNTARYNDREKYVNSTKLAEGDKRYQKPVFYQEVTDYNVNSTSPQPSVRCSGKSSPQRGRSKVDIDEECIRKPRAIGTINCIRSPTSGVNYSQNEIRRRIGEYRYPLVILRKDEIRSITKIPPMEPVQFNGVDKQIWPFMRNWDPEWRKLSSSVTNKQRPNEVADCKYIMKERGNWLEPPCTPPPPPPTINNQSRKGSISTKKLVECEESGPISAKSSIASLTDKMLKFLYKSTAPAPRVPPRGNQEKPKKIDKSTKTTPNREKRSTSVKTEMKKTSFASRSSFSKSDTVNGDKESSAVNFSQVKFQQSLHKRQQNMSNHYLTESIESIMLKVENGAYSNHSVKKHTNDVETTCNLIESTELIKLTKKSSKSRNNLVKSEEISVESSSIVLQSNETSVTSSEICVKSSKSDASIKSNSSASSLFDFGSPRSIDYDEAVLKLELRTLNPNILEIKNSDKNVLVQFDVTMANDLNEKAPKASLMCIPGNEEGQIQIFKAKASLLNAALPAELCTILPMMMRKIMNQSANIQPPALTTETTSDTVADMESLSPTVQNILRGSMGSFTKLMSAAKESPYFDYCTAPKVYLQPSIKCNIWKEIPFYDRGCVETLTTTVEETCLPNKNTCMSLMPYVPKNYAIPPIVEMLRAVYSLIIIRNLNMMFCYIMSRSINIRLSIFVKTTWERDNSTPIAENLLEQVHGKTLTIHFRKIFWQDQKENNSKIPCAHLEKEENNQIETLDRKPSKVRLCLRKHVLLTKKSKSASSISSKRSASVLSKITSASDFVQALGASKSMARVLDPALLKKILTCTNEMKAWMSEIQPQQALLILLLCNRCETHTLVKYRAVLVQGIAVNRITRTSELDMEISVLENEKAIGGIENIAGIPEQKDQNELYEELYWIAKTTASDYHVPFDANAEKLLKSLLQKRKKLSQSYLRVMARYVGLGLLKK